MARWHVFCEVRTKFLYIIWLNLSLQNFKVKEKVVFMHAMKEQEDMEDSSTNS